MKPSVRVLVLSLSLILFALPALARKPRVLLPQPRQVSTDVQYRVVILATNLDIQERRYQINRIVPQPLGEPLRELLHGAAVPAGDTQSFILSDLGDTAGLLEVTGAKQILIRARLEILEGGQRIRTVALPAVTAREPGRRSGHGHVLEHGGFKDLHLQGVSRTADGSVATDLTLVNLDAQADGTCGMALVDAQGEGIFGLPFLTLPAGAALTVQDALADSGAGGDILDAWSTFACEGVSFTIWAAVYRDHGRDVEYVLPSAELK